MLTASPSAAAPSTSSPWDTVGQVLSALCIAHCVVLPLVLGLLPAAAAGLLEDEAVHQGLIAFVAVSALAAFVPGWRRHRRASVVGLAAVALGMLGAAAFLLPEEAEVLETALTLSGGLLMTVAHGRNRAALDGAARVG